MTQVRAPELFEFAEFVDQERASSLSRRYAGLEKDHPLAPALATAVVAAFPAFSQLADSRPALFVELARDGWRAPRRRSSYIARMTAEMGDLENEERAGAVLRRVVQYEKLRIAARELLPVELDGADIDTTAAEISDLAEAAIDMALVEARSYAARRFGIPRTASGAPSQFVVLGMGKLGGRELNAGSDIDLLYLYDTDDGGSDGEALTLHEHWSRVSRRLTTTLDAMTEDGMIWRVDLRLRPEGSRGPIANSLPAAERYYETFGRLWERAALVRARPVAGDLELGRALLEELSPFVYARHVEPHLAAEMIKLVQRARTELTDDPERDIKLGTGGIREAEFFAQSLQLIWGGKDPRVRTTNTIEALRRLRASGLVTDREGSTVSDSYLFFRRVEHRIQWATGIQTHELPTGDDARGRLARSLGYPDASAFERDLGEARERVANRFASLAPGHLVEPARSARWIELLGRLDSPDLAGLDEAIHRAFGSVATAELVRDLSQLARRPDDLLGGLSRERFADLAPTFLDALIDAADPEQAARYLRTWLGRMATPGIYVRPLGEDPRALRRLVAVLGASAFVAQAMANGPELGDRVLFSQRVPDPEIAEQAVARELAELAREGDFTEDAEAVIGALRRAKAQITVEVALADLSGEIDTRGATFTLSALADATLEQASRFALGTTDEIRGLSVISVGKLGGMEIGYGSDLDVLFVYDPAASPPGQNPDEYFARRARRIIQLVSAAHPDGPGYELDTRLRPSGSHGMLVTSLEAFARYHGVNNAKDGQGDGSRESGLSVLSSGAAWERQALLRARPCAGDPVLGAEVMRVAHIAAYERGAPPAAEMHRLRMRMEKELARERPGRYDLKLGRGGLADIEFAVQFLQMQKGFDPRVRTTETPVGIRVLEQLGHLSPPQAEALREGYSFLRRLEQRMRIVHGTSLSLLEEGAVGLGPLARRMGMRDGPRGTGAEQLIVRYRDVTSSVRRAYLAIVGASEHEGEGA
jgi:glutamate-ammonia-ligase adenylyltransferase